MAHKHKFHRRNPTKGGLLDALYMTIGVTGGAVVSAGAPAIIASSLNTGVVGYAMNAAVAIGGYMLLGTKNPLASDFLAGGIAVMMLRIINDAAGISMLSAYWPSQFAVPTVSNSIGQTLQSPYPARVA
jgi:hypothetical protein